MSGRQDSTDYGKLRSWIVGHQILSFFLLAYAFSWLLWGLAALGGGRAVSSWADSVHLFQRS